MATNFIERLSRSLSKPAEKKDWLAKGGEFTVVELDDFALGPEVDKGGGRPLLLTTIAGDLRLVPRALLDTARKNLEETGDIAANINLILCGFYFYRGCVNTTMFAPHVFKEGAYEWPTPLEFTWDNKDSVVYFGSLAEGPRSEGGTISVRTGIW